MSGIKIKNYGIQKIMDHNLWETELSKFTVNRQDFKITVIEIFKVLVRKSITHKDMVNFSKNIQIIN